MDTISGFKNFEGLKPFSQDPTGCFCMVMEGEELVLQVDNNGPAENPWNLLIERDGGEQLELAIGTKDDLKQWMGCGPEVKNPLSFAIWMIILHESTSGSLGLAASLCLKLQVLLDDPGERAVVLLELARLAERVKNWDKALKYYKWVLQLEPTDEETWSAVLRGMARVHGALGHRQESNHYAGLAQGAEEAINEKE